MITDPMAKTMSFESGERAMLKIPDTLHPDFDKALMLASIAMDVRAKAENELHTLAPDNSFFYRTITAEIDRDIARITCTLYDLASVPGFYEAFGDELEFALQHDLFE